MAGRYDGNVLRCCGCDWVQYWEAKSHVVSPKVADSGRTTLDHRLESVIIAHKAHNLMVIMILMI